MAPLPGSCSAPYVGTVGTPHEASVPWASSSASALPLAAQAAQAAQLHGAAAAHAAQTAQVHVHAAQAAHALAQQAAEQLRGLQRLQPTAGQPPLAPEPRCLTARPSREYIASPQPQVTHWSYTSPQTQCTSSVYSTPSKYVAVRQYSTQQTTQSTSLQLPTPQGTPSSAPRRSHPAQLLGPVEELRRFPNLDNQKTDDKIDPLLQDHPLMQRPPPEAPRPMPKEDSEVVRHHLQALPKTQKLSDSKTPEPSPGRQQPEAPVTPPARPLLAEVAAEHSEEAVAPSTAALGTVKAIPAPDPSTMGEAASPLPLSAADEAAVAPTLPPTLASVEVAAPPPPPAEVEVPAELVTETEVPIPLERSTSRTEAVHAPTICDPAAVAAEALRSAVGRRDTVALRAALNEAVPAGTSWELIEWAHDRSRDIEHEAWGNRLQELALAALNKVLARTGASAETLSAACEYAWEAGVPAELLEPAREECGRRQFRQAAEEALLTALAQRSAVETLEPVLQRAEKASVSQELLHHARQRIEDLRHSTHDEELASKAEADLAEHVQSATTASQLEEALDAALQAHAPRKSLDRAWQKKVMLEIQAWQAKKGDLGKRRPSVAITSVPVKESTPRASREEKAAAPWTKEASGSSSGENYRGDNLAQSQGRWTVPPRLPTGAEAHSPPPRTPPPRLRSREKDEASSEVRDFRSQGCRPALRNGSGRATAAPRAASVGNRLTAASPRQREDLPCYGLDAELKAKAAAKYSPAAEEQAAAWIQAVTGHAVVNDFAGALRSGAVLCDLVNCIQPGTIAKVNPPGMPFKERENISNFLRACRNFGVQEYVLFSTDDLFEEKNLMSVVNCVYALGGAVQRSVPDFLGPAFGVPDTSNTKRDQKRNLGPVSQTGGLYGPLERSHVDVVSNSNVRVGGC